MAWGSRENDDNDLIDSAKSSDEEWQKLFNEQQANVMTLFKTFAFVIGVCINALSRRKK